MSKKKTLVLTTSLVAILLIAIAFISFKLLNTDKEVSVKKYYGVSHCINNITSEGLISENPEDAIPSQEDLIAGLEDKEYEITYYDTVFDTDISCSRIYAKKGDHFIDICYNLVLNAEDVFNEFDHKYHKYYLMAMNGSYVYCISDKKTFKDAGFKSLANNGIQFIQE